MTVVREFKLCGVQGCCPTVRVHEDGSVRICDDFGGSVQLSADEIKSLVEEFGGAGRPAKD